MEKHQIEDLRGRVTCAAVLEAAGFALDPRESTRRALKYRRAAEIVIVTHEEGIARRARRILRLRDGRIESDTPLVRAAVGTPGVA